MITGYNISPLPFYNSLNEQFAKQPCAFGKDCPLIYDRREIPSFLFHVNGEGDEWYINRVILVQADGILQYDITNELIGHGLSYIDDDTPLSAGGYFVRFGMSDGYSYGIPADGTYYLIVETKDGSGPNGVTHTYYSETFCAVSSLRNDIIRITYGNSENISTQFGDIPFNNDYFIPNPFKFRMNINALIGKPSYNFEETETNRNGYSFKEKMVSKKTYKFAFIAPEYVCDALRLLKLCSEVTITHRGKTYLPTDIDIDVKWEEQGDLASVTVTFDTDNVLYTIGGYTRDSQLVIP